MLFLAIFVLSLLRRYLFNVTLTTMLLRRPGLDPF